MSCTINENEIEMFKENNVSQPFIVKQKVTGTPVDITAAELTFSCKKRPTDTVALFERKNLAAGGDATQIEMTDPTNGKFTVHVIPANTETAEGDVKYHYDVQMVLAGNVITIIKDRLYIKQTVTDYT